MAIPDASGNGENSRGLAARRGGWHTGGMKARPVPSRRTLLSIGAGLAAGLVARPAIAQGCRVPDALGTARVLPVSTAGGLMVGRKIYPATLPLRPGEVVLTFDDGPWPVTTPAVLDALARECVRATFFLIGQNAAARPDMVRRIRAEGHTLAHHTMTHPILNTIPTPQGLAEIERGIAAIDKAAGGASVAPFFRFPGFGRNKEIETWMAGRAMASFGADLWASDWNPMTPDQQLRQVMGRLKQAGGGIVLMHDTKAQTAAMVPAFLRALKAEGYRVVHVEPA
jgi:peptidoglycan-N-acetylglucosamine deacetylase